MLSLLPALYAKVLASPSPEGDDATMRPTVRYRVVDVPMDGSVTWDARQLPVYMVLTLTTPRLPKSCAPVHGASALHVAIRVMPLCIVVVTQIAGAMWQPTAGNNAFPTLDMLLDWHIHVAPIAPTRVMHCTEPVNNAAGLSAPSYGASFLDRLSQCGRGDL